MKESFDDFSPEGITSYFTFRYPIGDITMFKGYRKIPFGNEFKGGKEMPFWYPRFDKFSDSFEEAASHIDLLLQSAIKKPVAAYSKINSGGCQHLRVAIRQQAPGEARKAIAAIFGAMMHIKHVFIVDEDVDVSDDEQMDWAMSTRFQADRDMVILNDMLGMRWTCRSTARP